MKGTVSFTPNSNMLKNKFLLIPFLIFILALILDRIFMLEKIQTYFTKTVSEINYFHKPILFEELKTYLKKPDRKKVLVYFGSSRALLFNNQYIEKNYPNWILFNFSVPGGTPDFFHFWIEQFQAENIKPDYVLLDSSIEAFNLDAKIKIDEVLVNGLDFPFIVKHFDRYSSKEITNFLAKKLFKTYQYRPKLDTILQRMKNNSEIVVNYRKWRKIITENLTRERGSASSDLSSNATSSAELVNRFSIGDFSSYIELFRFNQNMMAFHKENFQILQSMQVPYSSIIVKIANPYYALIKTKPAFPAKRDSIKTAYSIYYPKLEETLALTNTNIYNMNEEISYTCNLFTDASHMSSKCFPDYTDYIFTIILRENKSK